RGVVAAHFREALLDQRAKGDAALVRREHLMGLRDSFVLCGECAGDRFNQHEPSSRDDDQQYAERKQALLRRAHGGARSLKARSKRCSAALGPCIRGDRNSASRKKGDESRTEISDAAEAEKP